MEALELLDGIVDIYMPDMKYGRNDVGCLLSGVPSYSTVNLEAVREMWRQVGDLVTSDTLMQLQMRQRQQQQLSVKDKHPSLIVPVPPSHSIASSTSFSSSYVDQLVSAVFNSSAFGLSARSSSSFSSSPLDLAVRGLLVRHLILPENLAGTKQVCRFLASLSPRSFINIMGQYRPAFQTSSRRNSSREKGPKFNPETVISLETDKADNSSSSSSCSTSSLSSSSLPSSSSMDVSLRCMQRPVTSDEVLQAFIIAKQCSLGRFADLPEGLTEEQLEHLAAQTSVSIGTLTSPSSSSSSSPVAASDTQQSTFEW